MSRLKITVVAITAFVAGAVLAPAAATAVGYFSTTRVVNGLNTAKCPAGYRVTGGGITVPADSFSTYSSRSYKIRYSKPNIYGTAWTGQLTVTTGSFSSASGWRYSSFGQSATVTAVCVR